MKSLSKTRIRPPYLFDGQREVLCFPSRSTPSPTAFLRAGIDTVASNGCDKGIKRQTLLAGIDILGTLLNLNETHPIWSL